MPLTFVSAAHSPTSFLGQVSKAVTAGSHLFIGSVVDLASDVEATGVTDDQGNTWVRDAHGNTANRHIAIFRTIAGSTGTLNAQLAVSGTLSTNRLDLAEFTGELAVSPFDAASAVATGSGTTVTGNNFTVAGPAFLFGIGCADFSGSTFTSDAPWVDRSPTPAERIHIASREVSAAGSYNLSGSLDVSDAWGVIAASYLFPGEAGKPFMNPKNTLRPYPFAPGLAR